MHVSYPLSPLTRCTASPLQIGPLGLTSLRGVELCEVQLQLLQGLISRDLFEGGASHPTDAMSVSSGAAPGLRCVCVCVCVYVCVCGQLADSVSVSGAQVHVWVR